MRILLFFYILMLALAPSARGQAQPSPPEILGEGAVLERPLGRKLEQALLFRAKIVALTRDERAAVLAALERAPAQLDEVRKALLADENWRAGTGARAGGPS